MMSSSRSILFTLSFILAACFSVRSQVNEHNLIWTGIMDENPFSLHVYSKNADTSSSFYTKFGKAYNYFCFAHYDSLRPIIQDLRDNYKSYINDSVESVLSRMELVGPFREGYYEEAASTADKLLNSYPLVISETDKAKAEEYTKVFRYARSVAPPSAVWSDSVETTIATGGQVEVKCNGVESDFIFDTGANISVIMKSVAEKMGITIMPGEFQVLAITGIPITAQLGVADSLELGKVKVYNALFMVFPDEALTFPNGFTLQGLIGLPLIRLMGKVKFYNTGKITALPATRGTLAPNIALMDFEIRTLGIVNGDSLLFTFDSGAETTMMYPLFYDHFKEGTMIFKKGKSKFAGAGGAKVAKGYWVPYIEMLVGGSYFHLREIFVSKTYFVSKLDKVHGNLGQDVIGQYSGYTLDFMNMRLEFFK